MGYIVERKNGVEDYYANATYGSVDGSGHLTVNSFTADLIAVYAAGEWVSAFADQSKQKVTNTKVFPVWDFERRKAESDARRGQVAD